MIGKKNFSVAAFTFIINFIFITAVLINYRWTILRIARRPKICDECLRDVEKLAIFIFLAIGTAAKAVVSLSCDSMISGLCSFGYIVG